MRGRHHDDAAHGRAVNHAYERGWRDGWNAARAIMEEIGTEGLDARERRLTMTTQPLIGPDDRAV